MKKQFGYLAVFLFCLARISFSQAISPSTGQLSFHPNPVAPSTTQSMASGDFVHAVMQRTPWDRAVFFDGGFDVSRRSTDHFLNAGVRLGKILTGPVGPGILRGQFEYATELIPYWQAFTPKQTYTLAGHNQPVTTGGTYSGLSLTPIILRWNLVRQQGHSQRWMPWAQAAGGLIWTNHKFPPNGARGTSVWNFSPQFGVGIHYFLKPTQSITFGANAMHISSASLGDSNPGVNATVQLQIGYTWWK